jgi:RNA 3'-terminal phosphate cyclase (ATP)
LAESPPATRAVVVSAVAGLPEDIARRQARRAGHRLRQRDLRVEVREESLLGGPGTVLSIELDTAPVPTLFFALGERGKPAERVADEAADQTLEFLDAPAGSVDLHSADQLVLPLALAAGPSSFRVARVTSHLLTNLAVIRRFIERDLRCEGSEGKPGCVEIC